MSANFKKLPKSQQKGETPIDLNFFYSGEDQDFKNRVEMQGLDSDTEKFPDFCQYQNEHESYEKIKFRFILKMETSILQIKIVEKAFIISFSHSKIMTKSFSK